MRKYKKIDIDDVIGRLIKCFYGKVEFTKKSIIKVFSDSDKKCLLHLIVCVVSWEINSIFENLICQLDAMQKCLTSGKIFI